MYTQFNSRINAVYASRWHFDAGYEAIATFIAGLSSFTVTMKETGKTETLATLKDVNGYVADRLDDATVAEIWRAGLRRSFQ
jgi:hypothetical protein